jgi:hypothetical protein
MKKLNAVIALVASVSEAQDKQEASAESSKLELKHSASVSLLFSPNSTNEGSISSGVVINVKDGYLQALTLAAIYSF